jgi:hypothetical protein
LICFNPARDRDDPNVGLTVPLLHDVLHDRIEGCEVSDFTCRADLPDSAVVRHFSEYDFEHDAHRFFVEWQNALNG